MTRAHATLQRRPEDGESLVELLVTISIIGIAVVALVAGLATAITASAAHREQADAGAVARNVAEAIKDRDVALVASGTYPPSTWADVNIPSDVSLSVPTAKCWNGSVTAGWGSCPNSNGLQKITITASSPRSRETVTILKRLS